ncbi:23 kDa integral membrane protein-like [Centruroides vittatus]|uniref:23 kDa integral membrane protein-like n=1 Tax=Centruroides vittatus TaxID=120091 RepID=UPI003510777B
MLCFKYIFFVLNFLLFCLGLAIAGIGIWTLNDPNFLKYQLNLPIDEFHSTAYIIIVVGFVLVIIGFVGCCGAILDNACLLCLFSTVMIFLLLLGAAAALVIWIGLHNTTVRGHLEREMFKKLQNTDFFTFVEKNLKCCGVKGQEDYKGEIPESCKDNGIIYKEGCLRRMEILLKEKAAILGGMSATIAILAIIASIIAITIMCAVRRTSKAIV